MKRSTLRTISVLLGMAVLTGCGSATASTADTTAGGGNTSATASTASSETSESVGTAGQKDDDPIVVFRSSKASMPSDDPILPIMEDELGFALQWDVVTDEYDTQLNTRLAGGNIPDIFQVPRNKIGDYINQDLLMDVEPYLDQMPHLKAAYTEEDLNRGRYNGTLYTIPQRPYIPYCDFSIRKDWLDNLGMKMPSTLDELYDVMYAFTYNDPDGDGQQNTFAVTGTGMDALQNIFAAFGTAVPGNFLIKDNKVVYSSVDPEAKDAIEFVQKCVSEGLIDPELFSNTTETARDKCISGQAGIFAGITFWDIMKSTFQEQEKAVNPNAEWELLMGVKGPAGTAYDDLYDESAVENLWGINPDLVDNQDRLNKVLKLFDYLCDEESGQKLVMFGVEGVHYNMENGEVVPTDKMADLTHTYMFQLTGRDDLPYLKVKFSYLSDEIDQCVNMNVMPCYNAAIFAPENVSETDIERYSTEEMIKFIYGDRSLDEWDAYVDTLNSTYNLTDYLDKATSDLTEKGYIK